MSRIGLITFDMTGTLLKFRTPPMQQYANAAKKFGLQADPSDLVKNFSKSWRKLSAEHPNFGRKSIQWQNWWKTIVIETLATNATLAQKSEIAEYLMDHFQTANAWTVDEDGHKILLELKRRNISMGVISNFDPRLHRIIENLDLKDYFTFVLTSYDVGVMKPSVEIFRMAERKAGVACNEALHIGNDRDLDFQGAKDAGWKALLITDAPKAESEVTDLQEGLGKIKNLLCR